jgi:DNA-binding response OmpR family regulator
MVAQFTSEDLFSGLNRCMLRNATILIVQKSWPIANHVATAFERRGARTFCAPDATSALPFVHDAELSAAVLDSESQLLCAALSQRQIPYAIYTARSEVNDCDHGPIIRKPAGSEEVISEVSVLIKQHRE